MTSYGDVLTHPHPELDNKYTYVAPCGVEGFRLFHDLQRQTGADGGSLDFGMGLAWWFRGAWSLPPQEDIIEEYEFILAVVSAEEVARILDDYSKERDA